VDKDSRRTLHDRLSSLLPDYWVRMEIAAFSCLFSFSSFHPQDFGFDFLSVFGFLRGFCTI
jgi:hypothetical protein